MKLSFFGIVLLALGAGLGAYAGALVSTAWAAVGAGIGGYLAGELVADFNGGRRKRRK